MPYEPYLLIPLRRHDGSLRGHAIISYEDAHLAEHRWCLQPAGYAARSSAGRLNRVVLGLVRGDGLVADHINGDRLDNRRSNLRIVTQALNMQNKGAHVRGTSPYRGVGWDASHNAWRARVGQGDRVVFLGHFESETEAARVASAYRAQHMPYSRDAHFGPTAA